MAMPLSLYDRRDDGLGGQGQEVVLAVDEGGVQRHRREIQGVDGAAGEQVLRGLVARQDRRGLHPAGKAGQPRPDIRCLEEDVGRDLVALEGPRQVLEGPAPVPAPAADQRQVAQVLDAEGGLPAPARAAGTTTEKVSSGSRCRM